MDRNPDYVVEKDVRIRIYRNGTAWWLRVDNCKSGRTIQSSGTGRAALDEAEARLVGRLFPQPER